MGRKKTLLNNSMDFNVLYYHYKILSLSLFTWENLPNGIEGKDIELMLFNNGEVAFYNNNQLGLLCLKCSGVGANIYNRPTSYNIFGVGFQEQINAEDCIIIRNNINSIPTNLFINYYVKQLMEIDRSILANIRQQKFPFIIGINRKNELSMRNIIKQIDSGELNIYVDKELDNSGDIGINCLTTGVPYVVDKLQKQKLEVEKMLLSLLGINCTQEKKERLLTDEINANNVYVGLNLEAMYSTRINAVKEINKKFNLDIKVIKNTVRVEDTYRNTLNNKIYDKEV